jgi:hypothetical protein
VIGIDVGIEEGRSEGNTEGNTVGTEVVGVTVVVGIKDTDGSPLGRYEGAPVMVGREVGFPECEGVSEPIAVGLSEGWMLGSKVGNKETGEVVGDRMVEAPSEDSCDDVVTTAIIVISISDRIAKNAPTMRRVRRGVSCFGTCSALDLLLKLEPGLEGGGAVSS